MNVDSQLLIMNYELIFGRSGKAVGLSAISLLAIFLPRSLKIWVRHFDKLSDLAPSPSPNLVPETLAKDAAPIPNAMAAFKTKQNPRNPEFRQDATGVTSLRLLIPNS